MKYVNMSRSGAEPEAERKAALDRVVAKATLTRRPVRQVVTVETSGSLGPARQRARVKWQRPIMAIIISTLDANRGLYERMSQGMHGPDTKNKELWQEMFNAIYKSTHEQIKALEIFANVEWSE